MVAMVCWYTMAVASEAYHSRSYCGADSSRHRYTSGHNKRCRESPLYAARILVKKDKCVHLSKAAGNGSSPQFRSLHQQTHTATYHHPLKMSFQAYSPGDVDCNSDVDLANVKGKTVIVTGGKGKFSVSLVIRILTTIARREGHG